MQKKRERRVPYEPKNSPDEALDAQRANLRLTKQKTRRLIEAGLEAKTKRRRSREQPASAAWKAG